MTLFFKMKFLDVRYKFFQHNYFSFSPREEEKQRKDDDQLANNFIILIVKKPIYVTKFGTSEVCKTSNHESVTLCNQLLLVLTIAD